MASQDKLVRCKGNMWMDLQPELLVNIFQRLPLRQLLSVIPRVCKPWMRASLDPFCLQVLDLRELWTDRAFCQRVAHVLLRRTEGNLREFSFCFMKPDWHKVLESSAPVLQKLHIPYSDVTDEWIIRMAPLMTSLRDLDLSNSISPLLSHVALEAIGKHCRCITHLRRNKELCSRVYLASYPFHDEKEVYAIAQNYPSLLHLELRNNRFSTQGVRAILDGCPMLEHLDLSACSMDMDELLLQECQTRLRVFREPWHLLAEADEYDDVYYRYDYDDADDHEYVCCVCGARKMRNDCMSELDRFWGLCDCTAHDFTTESEYECESRDDDEEEDGGEDEDGAGVEDGYAEACQDEGEDDCEEEGDIDGLNDEEYVDDDASRDIDINEGEGEDEDGCCKDEFETGDENEQDFFEDDACGDLYIDEGEEICEDRFHAVDENGEDYVDDDDYARRGAHTEQGIDEDVWEDEYEVDDGNEEDYVDDVCADDDYEEDGEDDVFSVEGLGM